MRVADVLRMTLGLAVLATLASCTQTRPGGSGLPESGIYKVGQPYQADGVWYYPAEDWSYDETGLAASYAAGYRTPATANGEPYDGDELTAAHRTLPMPSLARVTNLDNGRSIVVRINDRGGGVTGRIITLSRRGAGLLGFEGEGVAKVRVQILADESRAVAAAARRNTPASLLAEQEGPAPRAAPRASVQIANAAPSGPADPVAIAVPQTVPGAEVGGRFMPAPVVTDTPVHGGRQLYVQAGAFPTRDSANRLQTKLAPIGPSRITTAVVNGQRSYRVRLGPLADVQRADSVLGRALQAGLTDAKIVVD